MMMESGCGVLPKVDWDSFGTSLGEIEGAGKRNGLVAERTEKDVTRAVNVAHRSDLEE